MQGFNIALIWSLAVLLIIINYLVVDSLKCNNVYDTFRYPDVLYLLDTSNFTNLRFLFLIFQIPNTLSNYTCKAENYSKSECDNYTYICTSVCVPNMIKILD